MIDTIEYLIILNLEGNKFEDETFSTKFKRFASTK